MKSSAIGTARLDRDPVVFVSLRGWGLQCKLYTDCEAPRSAQAKHCLNLHMVVLQMDGRDFETWIYFRMNAIIREEPRQS
jgi:hypothetical protein